jgi:hypothetical protein
MVDAANPVDPESESSSMTTRGPGSSLGFKRWISADASVRRPQPNREAAVIAVLLVVALGTLLRLYRIRLDPASDRG